MPDKAGGISPKPRKLRSPRKFAMRLPGGKGDFQKVQQGSPEGKETFRKCNEALRRATKPEESVQGTGSPPSETINEKVFLPPRATPRQQPPPAGNHLASRLLKASEPENRHAPRQPPPAGNRLPGRLSTTIGRHQQPSTAIRRLQPTAAFRPVVPLYCRPGAGPGPSPRATTQQILIL